MGTFKLFAAKSVINDFFLKTSNKSFNFPTFFSKRLHFCFRFLFFLLSFETIALITLKFLAARLGVSKSLTLKSPNWLLFQISFLGHLVLKNPVKLNLSDLVLRI